jgi:hypothetical protein
VSEVVNGWEARDGKETHNAMETMLCAPDGKDRMQAVHMALLPSGKVLMVTGKANDLFCADYLHPPDGNVLFAGGTRSEVPTMNFTGGTFANLFDWKKEQ